MKITKTAFRLSKTAEAEIDVSPAVAFNTKLSTLLNQLRGDLGELQNTSNTEDNANIANPTKDAILSTLGNFKTEIGLRFNPEIAIELVRLERALKANNWAAAVTIASGRILMEITEYANQLQLLQSIQAGTEAAPATEVE